MFVGNVMALWLQGSFVARSSADGSLTGASGRGSEVVFYGDSRGYGGIWKRKWKPLFRVWGLE